MILFGAEGLVGWEMRKKKEETNRWLFVVCLVCFDGLELAACKGFMSDFSICLGIRDGLFGILAACKGLLCDFSIDLGGT